MYKTRKSMQEIKAENKINEYALHGIGLSVKYQGSFWLSRVYIIDNNGPRVMFNSDDLFMAEKWFNSLNEAEKYIVTSFIDNIRKVM